MYREMSGPAIAAACRDDGAKWAAAFCEHAKAFGHDIDEDWMIGWFANAIETAHDVREGRGLIALPNGSAFFTASIPRAR